ncbi:MAG: zinc transporter ZntB [Waddliaceae bacterium]|nr:zinc transporter ZntB [Waddliaceae bacterium]
MGSHILFAYALDRKGGGRVLEYDSIPDEVRGETLTWVHLDGSHPDTRSWLRKEVSYLGDFIIRALLADETRPRMTQVDDGVLLILRGVNLNENADPEDMVSIRLWVNKNCIITIQRRRLKAVGDIIERMNGGKGPKDAGNFICMLALRLFERMEPVLTDLNEAMDDIEEEVLAEADIKLRKSIVDVRKKAIMFRRYMAPQRDAIGQLRMCEAAWLNEQHRHLLQESYNHVTHYLEDLDTTRERAQVVKDELASVLADKLNRDMYILSIVAAIFLPLGFLTGLLGINVGGIPGSDNEQAFWIFCAGLSVLVFIQAYFFRKMKWL